MQPLASVNDPRVVAFLKAWHENGRDTYNRHTSPQDTPYDRAFPKIARARQKYICLDCNNCGEFMVQKNTGLVFGIKGYGRAHRGKPYGDICELTRIFQKATKEDRLTVSFSFYGHFP